MGESNLEFSHKTKDKLTKKQLLTWTQKYASLDPVLTTTLYSF